MQITSHIVTDGSEVWLCRLSDEKLSFCQRKIEMPPTWVSRLNTEESPDVLNYFFPVNYRKNLKAVKSHKTKILVQMSDHFF